MIFSLFSKTENALETESKRHGLKYFAEGHRHTVADHPDLDPLIQGDGRTTIRNLLEGDHLGEPIQLFEIRYRMPRVGLGRREQRIQSVAKIVLPVPTRCIKIHTDASFNELKPIPGFQDLVLPNGVGQEVLTVRVEDISYANSFLNGEMRAFFSENRGLSLEINHGALFVYCQGALDTEMMSRLMDLAEEAMRLIRPGRRIAVSTLTPDKRLL